MVRLHQLRLQLRTHVIAFRLRLFRLVIVQITTTSLCQNLKMILCSTYEVAM